MKIFFEVMAIVISIFMFGTNDKDERKAMTIAYASTIVGIVALFVIDLAVALWAQ